MSLTLVIILAVVAFVLGFIAGARVALARVDALSNDSPPPPPFAPPTRRF